MSNLKFQLYNFTTST